MYFNPHRPIALTHQLYALPPVDVSRSMTLMICGHSTTSKIISRVRVFHLVILIMLHAAVTNSKLTETVMHARVGLSLNVLLQ